MRKILLAANAQDISTSAIDFGCYLANLTRSPLSAIFLEYDYKKRVAEEISTVGDEGYETSLSQEIAENRNLFCNKCMQNNARYNVRHVYGKPLLQMVNESRFADVILTDSATSFNEFDTSPSRFVKDLLEQAECPVMITPFDFDSIDEVVFAYDGTDSSIFAMKQFIYLFPELHDLKITLLEVLKKETDEITEKQKLKDFLMMYFNEVHYDKLTGEADMELLKTFIEQKNKILVMGAYGRRKFFSHSTADILLKTLNIPIFITHF